jgi:hypothetical protein
MNEEQCNQLAELLERSQGITAELLAQAKKCDGYWRSEFSPAKDIVEIWRHRASWNKNPQNSQAGKLGGIDAAVAQLTACGTKPVIGHSLGTTKTKWTIFTDPAVTQLLGIIENRIGQ